MAVHVSASTVVIFGELHVGKMYMSAIIPL